MILYALPQSPYCAKVRAVLSFKGIDFEEQIPAGGSYQTTAYQEVVAAGSVPAIQLDDWVLHDSQAIVEYLEDTYPEPSVWHSNPEIRAQQRALVHYHDTKLEPAVRALVPVVRQPISPGRIQQTGVAKDALFDRVFRLNRMVAPAPWLIGDQLCLADLTFPSTLYIGLDILQHLDSGLELPSKISRWLEYAMQQSVVASEVSITRGAIAQWLGGEGLIN